MKNNKGFSLIELIVVAGLMGVLIATGGSVIINLQKSMNGIHAQQELAALSSEIQGRMIAETVCTQAITLASNQLQSFNASQAASDSSKTQNGFPFVLSLGNGELIGSGQSLTSYSFKVESFELFDAQVINTNPQDQTYMANLIGRFKYQKSVSGPSEFQRRLGTLFVKVDNSNQIVSCSNTDLSLSGRDCKACQQNNQPASPMLGPSCISHPAITETTLPEGTTVNKIACNNGIDTYSMLCLNGQWRSIGACGKDSN